MLLHSATQNNPLYNIDVDGNGTADVQRMRTIFVGQYTHKFGALSSYVRGLAELHTLPPVRQGDREIAPGDYGYVFGAKLHLDLDNGNFNDISVRYGTRIANGAFEGAQTFATYGLPDPGKKNYDGAAGVEIVDHFLVNFNRFLTLNGYGTFHFDKGASGQAQDKVIDFAVGARSIVYAHKNFHMVNELTFQGRKDGDLDMGTAVKFSVVPTLVPSGELSAWARPHLRLIYTAGFYNQAVVDQKLSPYVSNVSLSPVAHYLAPAPSGGFDPRHPALAAWPRPSGEKHARLTIRAKISTPCIDVRRGRMPVLRADARSSRGSWTFAPRLV